MTPLTEEAQQRYTHTHTADSAANRHCLVSILVTWFHALIAEIASANVPSVDVLVSVAMCRKVHI